MPNRFNYSSVDTDVTTKYDPLKPLHSSSLETSEMLPSSDTKRILEEWGRLPKHLLSKGVRHMPCSCASFCYYLLLPVEGNGAGGSRV